MPKVRKGSKGLVLWWKKNQKSGQRKIGGGEKRKGKRFCRLKKSLNHRKSTMETVSKRRVRKGGADVGRDAPARTKSTNYETDVRSNGDVLARKEHWPRNSSVRGGKGKSDMVRHRRD